MNTLIKAVHFASQKHQDQKRKNNHQTPYINHPIEVVKNLSECGVTDINLLCAGILHDTLEDTNTTYSDLLSEFGETIAGIVQECSDDKKLDKVSRKKSQIDRAAHASDGARQVKLADKLSNLAALRDDPPTSWSQEVTIGYVRWCFVVCEKLYGVNEALDKKVKAILDNFGVKSASDQELDAYYDLIKGKD